MPVRKMRTEEQLLDDLINELNNLKVSHALTLDVLIELGNMTTKRAGEHDWAFMAGVITAGAKAVEELSSFIENLGIAHHQGPVVRGQGEIGTEWRKSNGEGTTGEETGEIEVPDEGD